MLTLISPLEGVLTLMNILGLYYSALGVVAPLVAGHIHAVHVAVSELQVVKAGLESFSYEYYNELKVNFDPRVYSDNSNEQWNVPVFYIFPTGGSIATCESVDGEIGCTVWNLSGGTIDNPCPSVVSYAPNPPPSANVSPNPTTVKNTFDTLLNELSTSLRRLGVNLTCTQNSVSYTDNSITVSYSCTIETPTVSSSPNKRITLNLRKEIAVVNKTYDCVCHTGIREETLATYDVASVQARVRVYDDFGNVILEENAPYIEYFLRRNNYTPTPVDYCRIVRG